MSGTREAKRRLSRPAKCQTCNRTIYKGEPRVIVRERPMCTACAYDRERRTERSAPLTEVQRDMWGIGAPDPSDSPDPTREP